jgi:hypothetical protein
MTVIPSTGAMIRRVNTMIAHVHRHVLVTALALIGVISIAGPAHAQMSYSVYTDMWGGSEAPTIWGYSQLDDGGGCLSGVEYQSTWMYGPGAVYSAEGWQVSGYGEPGDWIVGGSFTVGCNCAGSGGYHTTGVSMVLSWYLSLTTTYYTGVSPALPFCWYSTTACTSGYPTCTSGVGLRVDIGCDPFAVAEWLVALRGTHRVCLINVSVGTTGGGHCT